MEFDSIFSYSDNKLLNEQEKKGLVHLGYVIFCELRVLLIENKNQQAKDLVQAFHNTFLFLNQAFSFDRLKQHIAYYQKKHQSNLLVDYLELIENIQKGEK